jgi:photosystem II stability/assembly factor-like uncharacterized protein
MKYIGATVTTILFCLLCSGRAGAQWVWNITDSTASGSNDRLYSLSCSGSNCTACGMSLDLSIVRDKIIFKHSTDAGRTWVTQDPGLPLQFSDQQEHLEAVCQIDSRHAVAVGDTALIVKTSDGGETWVQEACPTRSILLAVDFSDTLTGIAVGTRPPVVLTTSDGGSHWNQASLASGDFYSCHSFGQGKFSAYMYGNGPVYSTSDWWQTVDSGAVIPYSIDSSPDFPVCGHCRFYSGDTVIAYGDLIHFRDSTHQSLWSFVILSADGGKSWQTPAVDSDYRTLDCISSLNGDTVLAGSILGNKRMLISTDRGATWRTDTLLFDSYAEPYAIKAIEFTTDHTPIGMFAKTLFDDNSFLTRGRSTSSSVKSPRSILYQTQIYPNPASGSVNIASIDVGSSVHFLDILGHDVLSEKISSSGTLTLDVSRLPPGMYAVIIEKNGQMLPGGKMILEADN